jgi:KDO2-lipid IV(A) lauroyltransferase
VLIVTGHMGAWELSSFYHSLMGYPMSMIARPLDNRRLDAFVNGIRCLHGNRVLPKDDFARGLLTAMRKGETVGILMDTNMTPPQGVFVNFFGKQACTASGVARVALKTGAAVLPGFMVWEEAEGATCCTSARNWPLSGPRTRRPTLWPPRNCAPAPSRAGFGAILTSGCGFIGRWKTRPAGEAGLY